MILSDSEIKEMVGRGLIKFDPEPTEGQYDTSSLDLRLSPTYLRYAEELLGQSGVEPPIFDPSKFNFTKMSKVYMRKVPSEGDGSIVLAPNHFVLATTLEKIYLPTSSGIAARVEGRSTLARIGLSVHLTAPTVHLGFRGPLTLEIKNHSKLRIRLRPGMVICQLILEEVKGKPTKDIETTFQNQTSPRGRE